MKHIFSTSVAFVFALALTLTHPHAQDPQALSATDAPANAVWLDSLDLSRAPLRTGSPPAASS